MSRKKRKSRPTQEYQDAELNIMPFIDVFSVLNTFLLMSAAFITLGVIKVQVPFFTNSEDQSKPKRTLEVKVDAQKDKIELTTSYSMAPIQPNKQTFAADDNGINQLHEALVRIRVDNKETDLVTLYSDDDVTYEQVVKVLDAIKVRRENDPLFISDQADEKELANKPFVFPKVVMGSVIL